MLANLIFLAFIFVDVIAQVKHQIELVLGHVLVRRVISLLEMLARSEGESHFRRAGIRGRHRARAADRALGVAGAEAIPVPAIRLETIDFDVHRVAELRRGDARAVAQHVAHAVIRGDFPRDFDRFRRQAAAGFERAGRNRVHSTTPRGVGSPEATPSAERIGRKLRPASRRFGTSAQQRYARQAGRVRQKQPPADALLMSNHFRQSA